LDENKPKIKIFIGIFFSYINGTKEPARKIPSPQTISAVVADLHLHQNNLHATISINVADPGCLSRILVFVHPGSKNSNKREG
jgi:hypothetical protein